MLHSRTGKPCLEGGFLSLIEKPAKRTSTNLEASFPSLLVDYSDFLQAKNSILGLMGIQGMRILPFGEWA